MLTAVSAGHRPMLECQIPEGAIKIVLPEVQQPDDYSCGAAATMSIAAYFGIGPKELEDFKAALETSPEHGTYFSNIVKYAIELGLDASAKPNMTKEELIALMEEKVPVIVSIQAYADDPSVYDNPDDNSNGHYVIPVGYDADNCYFMDPSITGRYGFLSWTDFEKRWHENEGFSTPEVHNHLGLIMRPKSHQPVYPNRALKIA